MSTVPKETLATVPVDDWTTADSAELYRTASWGAPYYYVNEAGHVGLNAMDEANTSIDVAAVIEELKSRGVRFPMLIRFQDVLRAQVQRLNEAFAGAIADRGYDNVYRGVYPIKVNQLHEVVDELLDAGLPYGMGLECGSKAELLASLPQIDGDTLLICNGVKDREMLTLMLAGQRLGQNVVPVIENYTEYVELKELAAHSSIVPRIGVRIRLATEGSGRWSESSGMHSKFGLSAGEVLQVASELCSGEVKARLVLLHCHIGSQIADISVLKRATKEVAQVYAELVHKGLDIEYLDLGGGLGVNYDKDHMEDDAGINYSLQEYANTVVGTVKEVCDVQEAKCPVLVTESGRALTAHHSVLIVPVLYARVRGEDSVDLDEIADEPESVQELARIADALPGLGDRARLLEAYHVAQERIKEVGTLFGLGFLTLSQRALAESIYWMACARLLDALKELPGPAAPEVAELEAQLTDQYLCDFSVFQSMLDHWAIGQPFPIMPISRLDERPTRRGVLVDLTCDSDGKVSHYVSSYPDKRYLPVHSLESGEPYYFGFFLMGAYEDIVGDSHNLFGRVTEAHVYADPEEEGNFWIEKIITGTAIQDVLAQVQYFPNDLHRRMNELVRGKIREGVVRPTQGIEILDKYMAVFSKSTYCEPREPRKEEPS